MVRFTRMLLFVVVALVAIDSAAQDAGEADRLFWEGRAAVRRGDWAAACIHFGDSYRLEAEPGTLVNLARCEENTGRLALALQHFREVISQLAANDARLTFARERVAALERRVATLTLSFAPGGCAAPRVSRDGEAVVVLPEAPEIVDPGIHVVV